MSGPGAIGDATAGVPAESAESIRAFIQAIEPMKSHVRSAWTADGVPESVAAHSWRLCMLALVVGHLVDGVDPLRLLEICLVHDLGEAIHGDVPAPDQSETPDRHAQERSAVTELTALVGGAAGERIRELWDEYDSGKSVEAATAKALDKIETIIQHNQGANPDGFDYRFNLDYGRTIPITSALIRSLRAIVDNDTAARASESAEKSTGDAPRNRPS